MTMKDIEDHVEKYGMTPGQRFSRLLINKNKYPEAESVFSLERWEGNDFIITYRGQPVGETVTEQQGKNILRWLNISKRELKL